MLDQETINRVNDYVNRDLPVESFYENLFTFITDNVVREQIIKEYKNARYFYKLLEGLNAEDDILFLETRIQIIMYASIEEAVITWVLFNYFSHTPQFNTMTNTPTLKRIDIPKSKKDTLLDALEHDSKTIVPCYESTVKVDKTKIRFEAKVNVAFELGLISESMKNDLIMIFEYRNTVHIEALIKKQLDYTLEVSKKAYRRVEGLDIELKKSLKKLGIIS